MRRTMLSIALLSLSMTLAGQTRRTVYVDRMEGLEPFVERALVAAELPFDFVEEAERPELKSELRRLGKTYGEILYKHKYGRTETHTLELKDVQSGKVVAAWSFQLRGDETSRRQAAEEFARRVKRALAKAKS